LCLCGSLILAGCLLAVSIYASPVGRLPISFEENRGQAAAGARFLARGPGYSLILTREGNHVVLRGGVSLIARLIGANANPEIRGERKLPGKVHYLRGKQSLTDIPTYGRVRYDRVYPGIDLVYYGNQHQLEYDFIVKPGSDPQSIRLSFDGADAVRLDDEGNLVLHVRDAQVVQLKPVVYQDIAGVRREIRAEYRLLSHNTIGFEIAPYDRNRTLVIDPVLSYSTYLGGSDGDDDARAVAADSSGNIYIAGTTTSTNFPTRAAFQGNAGSQDPEAEVTDAFVTKLNAAGTALVYSTYIGGTNDDEAGAIAVDSAGNVAIAGSTASTNDFPTTPGALRRTCNLGSNGSCLDAFVAKLNSTGSALIYSTYLGGTGDDDARGVAVDSSGGAYVTGRTTSTNFTTTAGAFSTDSSTGGFVTKLSATGALVYSTYFGAGSGAADPKGIAIDSSGNAYVTGASSSSTATGTDVFVTKLNPTGTAAAYSQFIRGAKDDTGNGIAVDSAGNAYVAGQTASIDFTTTAGVLQRTYAGGPAFRTSDSGSNWSLSSTGITRGSLHALAITPGNPSTIYAGADDDNAGGVFKTIDGGNIWSNSSTGLTDGRVHALAVDPSNPATVFAGTRSAGVFKSTDAGASWVATTGLTNIFVTAIVIDPVTTTTIYAATDANGVYKSTNAGASWSPAGNSQLNVGVRTLAINPVTPAIVYAGTGGGIYKTTDGGATWTPMSSGLFDPNINALVLDPRNPNLLYAATNSVGIFRSANAGAFWLASNSGLISSSSGILATALAIDAGTGSFYAAIGESNASRVYKSSNGITWTPTTLATSRVTALAVDSSSSNSVHAATVGGSDAFVAKWNAAGALVFSTYLGGSGDDAANAIAIDAGGNAHVTGDTSSANFPSVTAVQTAFGGGSDVVTDAFVAKLTASAGALTYSTYLGGSGNDFGKAIAVDSSGNAYIAGLTASSDFPTAFALTGTQPGLLDAFVAKIAEINTISYTVPARGGISTSTQGSGSAIDVGYARIQPAAGGTTPSAMAIFGFRQSGILVSEAAVPASPLISAGRTYAEVGDGVDTGVAIANPGSNMVTVSFYFTDRNGQNFGSGTTTIPANGQIARFLSQAPFLGPAMSDATFTFTSSSPVAAIALRGFTNERSEFLITTLPVADLSISPGTESILFPHFANGGGWTTQILLVNTTEAAMTGSVQFSSGMSANYNIPARSSTKVRTTGVGSLETGSVQVLPSGGTRTPAGVAVFSLVNGGVTVTEAGVPALRLSNAFRLYAESSGVSGQTGSIETGVAVANPSSSPISVTFELTTLAGVSIGLVGSATVPANGQAAMFLGQIQGFEALPNPFRGVLRVSTSSPAGIALVGLRGRYNERRDFLITTTQPTDEARPASTAEQFFPHLADGGGYTTQFILFNGSSDQSASGLLRFFTEMGQSLNLIVR
jgi:photosystem II stability/assembly factor-like uncharacterized protein